MANRKSLRPPALISIRSRPIVGTPSRRSLGKHGACGGCWCMFWRRRPARSSIRGKAMAISAAMQTLVKSGAEPRPSGLRGQ